MGVNNVRKSPKCLGLLFQCCYLHWKEQFQFSVIDFSVMMFSITILSFSVQLNVFLDSETGEVYRTIHFDMFLKIVGTWIQLAAVVQ